MNESHDIARNHKGIIAEQNGDWAFGMFEYKDGLFPAGKSYRRWLSRMAKEADNVSTDFYIISVEHYLAIIIDQIESLRTLDVNDTVYASIQMDQEGSDSLYAIVEVSQQYMVSEMMFCKQGRDDSVVIALLLCDKDMYTAILNTFEKIEE
jgi:hypothetical protein